MQSNFDVSNMLDVFEIYEKMEQNNVLLSFKGEITSDLLTSILQIMENKMVNMQEEPKLKKKVYSLMEVKSKINVFLSLELSMLLFRSSS